METDQSLHPDLLPGAGVVDVLRLLQTALVHAHVRQLTEAPGLEGGGGSRGQSPRPGVHSPAPGHAADATDPSAQRLPVPLKVNDVFSSMAAEFTAPLLITACTKSYFS